MTVCVVELYWTRDIAVTGEFVFTVIVFLGTTSLDKTELITGQVAFELLAFNKYYSV